jgi:hypothetical protein
MATPDELRKLEDAIRAQEALLGQGILPDEQIQATLEALCSKLASFQAEVKGSGAIAQQDGTALGQQAMHVNGNVSNSLLNTGVVNLFFKQYQSPPGKAELLKSDFERILNEYLKWVARAYSRARLYGLESMHTTREPRRNLSDVFVPITLRRSSPPHRLEIDELAHQMKDDPLAKQKAYLRAIEQRRHYGDTVSLSELFTKYSRLAIIGGAGCGKSTLAAYLAASLAEAAQADK